MFARGRSRRASAAFSRTSRVVYSHSDVLHNRWYGIQRAIGLAGPFASEAREDFRIEEARLSAAMAGNRLLHIPHSGVTECLRRTQKAPILLCDVQVARADAIRSPRCTYEGRRRHEATAG